MTKRKKTWQIILSWLQSILAGNYLFKVNHENNKVMYEKSSKLTINTPERRQWRPFGVFIINFEHISHAILVISLLTLNK